MCKNHSSGGACTGQVRGVYVRKDSPTEREGERHNEQHEECHLCDEQQEDLSVVGTC